VLNFGFFCDLAITEVLAIIKQKLEKACLGILARRQKKVKLQKHYKNICISLFYFLSKLKLQLYIKKEDRDKNSKN